MPATSSVSSVKCVVLQMLAKEILMEEIRAHIGRLFQREIAAAVSQ